MLAKAVICLGLWLQLAAGQGAPERGPQLPISHSEGDLLFLLDSSGSVSYYEFSRVKEFMWDLVHPFPFGPQDVQASIIHISTTPTMEFPFNQHLSSSSLQKAIQGTRQLMGDTNTGRALSYAKEKLFSDEAGARADVPKVLVWVTDGFSTDDISEPMQLLKDMGVTVFIVSTGRGNYLELSAAASQPPEKHLYFVDVDDLPIITKELRDAILDVIQANQLHAVDITSSSFRLTWPKLLSQDTDYYTLQYAPTAHLQRKTTQQVPAAHTTLVLSNLAPETTYEVALIPESNVHYFPPQTIRVTTLAEEISPAQVLISDSGPHSFHVSWAPSLDSVIRYQILYGPLPGNSVELLEVDGKLNSSVLENLAPNTTYLVTVTAVYRSGLEKSLSAKACTQEEGSKVRHLRFEDVGSNTLKASWDSADGKVLGYRVRCRRQSGPSSVISVSPQVHSVLLTGLAAGTATRVCVKAVYHNQPSKGLCRTVHTQPATEARGYKHRRRA